MCSVSRQAPLLVSLGRFLKSVLQRRSSFLLYCVEEIRICFYAKGITLFDNTFDSKVAWKKGVTSSSGKHAIGIDC